MRSTGRGARPPVRWAVRLYDRAYRFVHRLDEPAAQVGTVLCVEVRRSRRMLTLPDGTVICRGDLIGILHLNNARIFAIHLNGSPPQAVGLEFRRWFISSLHELARLAAPSGPLASVRAFGATTIFHVGLARLGFQIDRDGPFLPGLVAVCQRLLLASLHPRGAFRLRRATYRRARRLWLTREALLSRYGPRPSETGVGPRRGSRESMRGNDRAGPPGRALQGDAAGKVVIDARAESLTEPARRVPLRTV